MTNLKKYLEKREERIGKSRWNENNNEEKSNKNFYIVENKKSYTREELKEILN